MKTCLLIIFLPAVVFSQKDTIYMVPEKVPIIQQPKKMDCWITVTTMMLSWKDGKTYSIEDVITKLGEPWNGYYRNNTGLTFEEQDDFIGKVGMVGEPPANYLLKAYLDFLKKHGPLWITTGDGFNAHARLLIGIEGDGSYNHSDFVFINPDPGKVERQNALDFVKEFEAEAYAANEYNWERLRIQIYHF